MRVAVGDGWTAAANAFQLAFAAFRKFIVLAECVHFFAVPHVVQVAFVYVADFAFHAAAGVNVAVRQNRDVISRAVAAVRYLVAVGDFQQAFFVQEQIPQMVFQLERRL